MTASNTVILTLQIPFLYAYEAARASGLPFTSPIAVAQQNRVIDLSPTAVQAGATLNLSIRTLRHMVPELKVLPYNAETGRTTAENICAVCSAHSPVVEPVAQHLVLVDLTGCPPTSATNLLTEVKQTANLPICAGFAPGRAVSLCAAAVLTHQAVTAFSTGSSGSSNSSGSPHLEMPVPKPAVLHVAPGDTAGFLAPLSIQYLTTMGFPDADTVLAQLISLGISTIGELANIPIANLIQQFGTKKGPQLHNLALGFDSAQVLPLYPPDRAVATYRATDDSAGLSDLGSIDQIMVHLSAQLADSLTMRGKAAGLVQLEVAWTADRYCATKRLKQATMRQDPILAAVRFLWSQNQAPAPVRCISITGAELTHPVITQGDAFHDNATAPGLSTAMQAVQHRFGAGALHKGVQMTMSRRELVRWLWESANL